MRVQRLPREPGQVWRAIGLAGVVLCSVLAGSLVRDGWAIRGSVSERPALVISILLVLLWFMPLTAIAVVLGAVPGQGQIPEAVDGRRRVMVWLLRAGALWCLASGAGLKYIERQGGTTGNHPTLLGALQDSFPVLLPALFAVLVWACAAVILRPAATRQRWFRVVLEVCGVLEVAPVAVSLSETLPWSFDPVILERIAGNFLWMGAPSLALVVVIGQRLSIVRRHMNS